MKLNLNQLRKLIKEAVEKAKPEANEAFGVWDSEQHLDQGDEDRMMPHNFEHAQHEIFYQMVNQIENHFKKAIMEIYDAGFAPEGRNYAFHEVDAVAEELHSEIMNLIEECSKKALDKIV